MQATDFKPKGIFKNPHIQSLLASSGLRSIVFKRRIEQITKNAEEIILDLGPDTRLQGFYTEPGIPACGLVVLLHGWEGSAQSTYLLSLGARLLAAGYAVFRLNFRDHGETHHLTEGIFHSCRIEEITAAVAVIAQRCKHRPLIVGGYSLGGNFALRVALRRHAQSIPLDYVFAVCPAIHPPHVLQAIEQAPTFYHAYFMYKWRRSLRLKQRAFPQRYDFSWVDNGSMRAVTQGLVERYTDFGNIDNYLNGYSIAGDKLATIDVAGMILTASDDPVCPLADFLALQLSASIELNITEHGGHCGFASDISLNSFAEDFVLDRLTSQFRQ